MQKILFIFLRLAGFWRKFLLRIRGKTEEDIYNQRVTSGKAWEQFCGQLKLAGANLLAPGTPGDPFQQAEGIRYLSRLTRAGLEAFVEFNDPAFPVLRRTVHETIKMGADNPDNYYFNAQISGNYEYRITGRRNTVHYLGFFTQNGTYATTGGMAPCGKLDHRDMKIRDDGSFEIILSGSPKGENWLKTEEATSLLIVRQTFYNREMEKPAEIRIDNLMGSARPAALTPKALDEGLKTASMLVGGASLLFAGWANNFRKHTNILPMFDPAKSNAAGGDPGIIYYHSHWQLADDEALVIDVRPPDCDNWNFQLNNYWLESLDYRYFNVCINKGSAVYNNDGSVRVVVSKNDPGVANWLETAGHNEGTMCWRWYQVREGAVPVEPACRVVRVNEIS